MLNLLAFKFHSFDKNIYDGWNISEQVANLLRSLSIHIHELKKKIFVKDKYYLIYF